MQLRISRRSASQQLFLTQAVMRVDLADGTSIEHPLNDQPIKAGGYPAMPDLSNITWVPLESLEPSFPVAVTLPQAQGVRVSRSGGIRRITVTGRVQIFEAVIDTLVPFRTSELIVRPGHRAMIGQISYENGWINFDVKSSEISGATAGDQEPIGSRWFTSAPTVALLNTARGEAMPLFSRDHFSGMTALGNFAARIYRSMQTYYSKDGYRHSINTRDATWFDGAQFASIRWRDLGSYPIQVSTVPADSLPPSPYRTELGVDR
jgi:hypothetical protein